MIFSEHKNKKIARLISISLTAILIFLPVSYFITNHHYDQQGANIKNFKTSQLIATDDQELNLFEQTFYSNNDELESIIFYLKNESFNNDVELSLFDHDLNKTVRLENFKILAKGNIQLFQWDFENIKDAKNKQYSLFIMPSKKDFKLLGTSSELYDAGELYINGEKNTELMLAFSFDYHSDNLLTVLHQRLGVYKTGIFKNSWSFYILYLLTLLLVAYTSYEVSLAVINKE